MEYVGSTGNDTNTTRSGLSIQPKDATNCSNFMMICIGNFSGNYSTSSACDVCSY